MTPLATAQWLSRAPSTRPKSLARTLGTQMQSRGRCRSSPVQLISTEAEFVLWLLLARVATVEVLNMVGLERTELAVPETGLVATA
jgi:hypothetical protein